VPGRVAAAEPRQELQRASDGVAVAPVMLDDEAAGKPVNLLPAGIGSVPPTGSTSGRELAARV
jgi:hypothetical protein